MTEDEKDKAIEYLRAELARHKEGLTAVYEMKVRWQKNRDAYGKRYTVLHNEYIKLVRLLQQHQIPLPELTTPATIRETIPVMKVNKGRRRWKGREEAA